MANTILLKRNTSNSNIPESGDLQVGEPVVNAVSGRFYIKDTEDVVIDVNANIIDITVAGNPPRFQFDGVRPVSLRLHRGDTYVFRQSDASNSGNTLYISTTEARDYSNVSTRYTSGVTTQGNALVWKIPYDVPDLLYINSQETDDYGLGISFGTQFIQALPFTTHAGASDPLGLDWSILPTYGVYTNAQVDSFLADKSDDGHTHAYSELTGAPQGNNVLAADSGSNSTVALGSVITFAGTEDEVNTSVNSGTITIGLVDNPTISGNLHVTGDLTVGGAFETISSTTLLIGDKEIVASSVDVSTLANDAAWLTAIDGSGLSLGAIESNTETMIDNTVPTDHNFLYRKTNSVWATSENDALRAGNGVLYLGDTNKISADNNEVSLEGGITELDGGDASLDNFVMDGGTF